MNNFAYLLLCQLLLLPHLNFQLSVNEIYSGGPEASSWPGVPIWWTCRPSPAPTKPASAPCQSSPSSWPPSSWERERVSYCPPVLLASVFMSYSCPGRACQFFCQKTYKLCLRVHWTTTQNFRVIAELLHGLNSNSPEEVGVDVEDGLGLLGRDGAGPHDDTLQDAQVGGLVTGLWMTRGGMARWRMGTLRWLRLYLRFLQTLAWAWLQTPGLPSPRPEPSRPSGWPRPSAWPRAIPYRGQATRCQSWPYPTVNRVRKHHLWWNNFYHPISCSNWSNLSDLFCWKKFQPFFLLWVTFWLKGTPLMVKNLKFFLNVVFDSSN